VLSGGGQHTIRVQVRKLPLAGGPVLALDLMYFDLIPAPDGEFRTQADLSDVLDRNGIDVAEEDIEKLASGPSAFVPVTELGSLAACAWNRSHLPAVR
jgi:hypothetical protein